MKASHDGGCRVLVRVALVSSLGVFAAGPVGAAFTGTKAEARAVPARTAAAAATGTWAARLSPGADPAAAAAAIGGENLGPIGRLADTYLFRIPADGGATAGLQSAKAGVVALPLWMEQQVARRYFPRAWNAPTDSLFADQWHLVNTGQSGGTVGIDANVLTPVWDTDELSGSGVVIGIVDNGLQHAHPDLAPNYHAALSYDFNDDDADPAPTTLTADDGHGTAAAGVAAASMDGASCGIGVAYGAGLAGIRLIAAEITDAQIASALSHQRDAIHLFNNSWGPADDATDLHPVGTLTAAALADNVAQGRGGRGSIYVWAGGNGGLAGDNVNYDGLASSRHTIAVGAVDHDGVQSWYSEPGASLLVVTPSSGDTVGITTTDLAGADGYNADAGAADGGDCTDLFGGTSSSTPLASGAIALMLEANPELTWRDVQHILVQTARQNDAGDGDWRVNGGGLQVNHKYGFGLVDAAAAVAAAKGWTPVADAVSLASQFDTVNQAIPSGLAADDESARQGVAVSDTITIDADIRVEHVEVAFKATHPYRGDLKVVLVSPAGSESVLADSHAADGNGDYDWTFTTVRHWDEDARGKWTLRVSDGWATDNGRFDGWRLTVYGTATPGGVINGTTGDGGSGGGGGGAVGLLFGLLGLLARRRRG